MTYVDYTCSRCGVDHARPVEQCPFVGYAPRSVTRGPTPEEIRAQEQARQEKIDAEHRERQREQKKLERKHALARAMFDEDMKRFHQQRAAALAAKSAEIHAQMAEARAQMGLQAQAGRMERRLAAREGEQNTRRAAQRGGDGKWGGR